MEGWFLRTGAKAREADHPSKEDAKMLEFNKQALHLEDLNRIKRYQLWVLQKILPELALWKKREVEGQQNQIVVWRKRQKTVQRQRLQKEVVEDEKKEERKQKKTESPRRDHRLCSTCSSSSST